ncbi:dihydrofolate reductase family protein [Leuconostoc fallax]|uniref:dihydrofolate reductase family protein n=1 Tax=Leuconostoc fallax TaxID=1251 RepID=UPI002091368A|nr:dihydrofolate reductase family protein [Leuconostoc fallax]MCO6183677.1 dihydrofolate reductase family protein [Leuconostoc fallax]
MSKRKIILYIAMSLDGYIARLNGSIDWLESDDIEQKEDDNTYNEFYKDVDTVILGKKTYDQVVNELAPQHYPYSDVDSFVLTSHREDSKKKIHFTNSSIVDLVGQLTKSDGKNIWIVGGNSIIKPLVEHNLIDEYIIAVIPQILGEGIPLFGKINQEVALTHKQSYVKNGMTYLNYEKK